MKLLNKSNFDIVSDFDRTITSSDSLTSWGIIGGRGVLPKEYDFERNSLYNYYRPIELDNRIDDAIKMVAMNDWFSKHFDLFIKYKLNKTQIVDILSDRKIMSFRNGFLEFFNYLDINNIKIKILSAGIGDFVLRFFEMNRCSFVNLNIRSNFFKFDRNGVVIGIDGPAIHTLNKHLYAFKKEDKDFVVLLGDQISDIMMIDGYSRENVIAVAFVSKENIDEIDSFKDIFDMVLTDDIGFDVLLDDLKNVIE